MQRIAREGEMVAMLHAEAVRVPIWLGRRSNWLTAGLTRLAITVAAMSRRTGMAAATGHPVEQMPTWSGGRQRSTRLAGDPQVRLHLLP
jgi:hypothetical protein